MNKAIVTTTINPPTKALLKFIEIGKKDGWSVVIVGDQKTPHNDYKLLDDKHNHVHYLTPEMQSEGWPELSRLIGWNCIQRRNFGLLMAYHELKAEVIATVDDDNIPYDDWGKDFMVGKVLEIQTYHTEDDVFDPLSPIFPHLWHRGFPIQNLDKRTLSKVSRTSRKVLVQADFWDDAPDVDAVCRATLNPRIQFEKGMSPFCSDKIAPFNSQNTFLHRSLFPTYFLFPGVGRMDDIWAAYVTQFKFPDSVVFAKASVKQERNEHDIFKDLEAEMLGYQHNHEFVKAYEGWQKFLPAESLEAYEEYQRCFNG